MTPQLLIEGVDRTSLIEFGSPSARDNINSQADTLEFAVLKYGSQTWRPEIGQEVEYFIGAEKIYGGIIVTVRETDGESRAVLRYSCTCRDYTQEADRLLITESFEDETAEDIVEYLVATYAPGFTSLSVVAPVLVSSIAFNRIPLSQALDRMAKLLNYSWYIDYDKDVHFVPKNTEIAPFAITDDNGNLIAGSLDLSHDLSQLRNRVFVRGGETSGTLLSEFFTLDGTDASKTITTAFKYATMPQVFVDGVEKTVLPDYLNETGDADYLWGQDQQYLRSGSAWTTLADGFEVRGIPAVPIVVEIGDSGSIAEYGVYEFAINEPKIKTRAEAMQYAQAQLQAYADGIVEGSFSTYTPGLRSGQTITISSAKRGFTGQKYVIQSVTYRQLGGGEHIWQVTLATYKTLGIIDVLQKLLRDEVSDTQAGEILMSLLTLEDSGEGSDAIEYLVDGPPYYYARELNWDLLDENGYTTWVSLGSQDWEDLETDESINTAEWNRASWS